MSKEVFWSPLLSIVAISLLFDFSLCRSIGLKYLIYGSIINISNNLMQLDSLI